MKTLFKNIQSILVITLLLASGTTFGASGFCNSTTVPAQPGMDMMNCDSKGDSYSAMILGLYKVKTASGSSTTHTYKITFSYITSVWTDTHYTSCKLTRDKVRGYNHSTAVLGTFAVPNQSGEIDVTFTDSFSEKKYYDVTYSVTCQSTAFPYYWYNTVEANDTW